MAVVSVPTYHQHTLLTMGGALGSGADAEQWQMGIRIAQKNSTDWTELADLTAYLNAIHGGLQTIWFNATPQSSPGSPASYARLDWLKAANIGPNGKYDGLKDATGGPNPAVYNTTMGAGLSNASSVPDFVTLCISFHTSAPTKYARRGRIYPPLALQFSNTGSPRVSGAVCTTAAQFGASLLTAISKPAGLGGNAWPIRPVVASRHGEIAEINEVRVGDVADVQRRRKRSLRDNYTKMAWS